MVDIKRFSGNKRDFWLWKQIFIGNLNCKSDEESYECIVHSKSLPAQTYQSWLDTEPAEMGLLCSDANIEG